MNLLISWLAVIVVVATGFCIVVGRADGDRE